MIFRLSLLKDVIIFILLIVTSTASLLLQSLVLSIYTVLFLYGALHLINTYYNDKEGMQGQ